MVTTNNSVTCVLASIEIVYKFIVSIFGVRPLVPVHAFPGLYLY